MDLIETLASFFNKPKEETEGKTPEGFCPNCWGQQKYDGKFRDLVEDKQVDVNDHRANYAFIQKFVVENLDGIKLKNAVHGAKCPKCKYVRK